MKLAALVFLWVIHISAVVGVFLGYESFFLPKSPFTLLYILVLLISFYPVGTRKTAPLFALCFIVGMGSEWIGVHTGLLFGNYTYGVNFGPRVFGVPLFIGFNWGVLTFITHAIAKSVSDNKKAIVLMAASLMVFLDFFLEQISAFAGFWSFVGGVGWYNYVCWFIIACLLHVIMLGQKLEGDRSLSLNIYSVQLVFAAAIWGVLLFAR